MFCPVFSLWNKILIMKSPQSSLTPLLLAPSLQLPATNHWGVYTAMQTDTHTHTHDHARTNAKKRRKRHTDARRLEYFKQGFLDGSVMAIHCSQMWQQKLSHSFGRWVSSRAGCARLLGNYSMQIWFRRHFQMTDRLPNWQLACVGFSLAGTVWLSGDKWNGYTLLAAGI